ncbi:MAG: pseudouridine synthase [Phycisphaerales bacterium]
MKQQAGAANTGIRLQRVLADAGVAARRACERLIEEGRVTVNGEVVRTLPVFVHPKRDRIVVDGEVISRGGGRTNPDGGDKPVRVARKVYVMLNKPPRVLTTASDPGGRTTVADLVKHPTETRLFAVGRLDYHDAGLVLMTNDGDMANRLTHARYGATRTYHVMVKGRLDEAFVNDLGPGLQAKLARAVKEIGGRPGKIEVRRVARHKTEDERAKDKTVLEVTLHAGKHVGLEELFGAAGVTVAKIIQVAVGPLVLKGVTPGDWRELDRQELFTLKRATGAAHTGAKGPAGGSDGQRGSGGRAAGPTRGRAGADRSGRDRA